MKSSICTSAIFSVCGLFGFSIPSITKAIPFPSLIALVSFRASEVDHLSGTWDSLADGMVHLPRTQHLDYNFDDRWWWKMYCTYFHFFKIINKDWKYFYMTVLCFHLDTVLFENNENSDPGSSKGCAYALTLERVLFFFFFFFFFTI